MTKSRVIITALVLGFTPMAVVLLGPKLFFWIGNWVGYYLRKKTAGMKAQILELTTAEEREWEETNRKEKEKRRDSDEWENVEGYAVGTMGKNGENGGQEWNGIVGFFHPFW